MSLESDLGDRRRPDDEADIGRRLFARAKRQRHRLSQSPIGLRWSLVRFVGSSLRAISYPN
jgi:hypothetical protein